MHIKPDLKLLPIPLLRSPRAEASLQCNPMHFIGHVVTLIVGGGEDFVGAAAGFVELHNAGAAIVLEGDGPGGGEGGEEEEGEESGKEGRVLKQDEALLPI
ncbi:MAG: hypothetical protein Q9166_006999 [cf. Caloplaca sp. 2 TL-2023]